MCGAEFTARKNGNWLAGKVRGKRKFKLKYLSFQRMFLLCDRLASTYLFNINGKLVKIKRAVIFVFKERIGIYFRLLFCDRRLLLFNLLTFCLTWRNVQNLKTHFWKKCFNSFFVCLFFVCNLFCGVWMAPNSRYTVRYKDLPFPFAHKYVFLRRVKIRSLHLSFVQFNPLSSSAWLSASLVTPTWLIVSSHLSSTVLHN